jgi:hypothetical protein
MLNARLSPPHDVTAPHEVEAPFEMKEETK